MSAQEYEAYDEPDYPFPKLLYGRAAWEQERRLMTASLFDRVAETSPDDQSAETARWQASIFRWSAGRTR